MEKKKRFIVSAAYYSLIAAIVYLLLKYALSIVAPFVIGFGVAAILNPLVRKLSCKFHMKRKAAALFILLIFYAAIGTALSVIIVRTSVWIGQFSKNLPELYGDKLEPMIVDALDSVRQMIAQFNGSSESVTEGVAGLFDYLKSSLATMVSNISVGALRWISGFAAAIPEFMVELLFSVISSFFFIMDFEGLISIIKSRLPKKAVRILFGLRKHFTGTVFKYFRSYTLIMLITFSELFFGLSLIGIRNAFFFALIIALLDMLPVIGTGVLLLPWAAVELINHNTGIGVGLIVLWAIILIVRNIIEPKIVGGQVGLNPLATLFTMFVGTKLFGFFGLFLAPICLSVGISVYKEQKNHSESA